LEIIKNELIPNSDSEEGKVFYYKMKGDYHRYLAEVRIPTTHLHSALEYSPCLLFFVFLLRQFQNGDVRKESAAKALEAYSSASTIATHDLPPTHPIRLGLALNFSVFHYEVMQDVKRACELGDKALKDALDKLDDCDEETFRDAQSIIELLRENLGLWKDEEDAE
jgi:14-3-3 protein epsilon